MDTKHQPDPGQKGGESGVNYHTSENMLADFRYMKKFAFNESILELEQKFMPLGRRKFENLLPRVLLQTFQERREQMTTER